MEPKLLIKRCHYLKLLTFRKPPELPPQLNNAKCFNERLILSQLAYSQRLGKGLTISRLARETGLAVRTVKTTIERLGACLTKVERLYHLVPTAHEWFLPATTSGDHWSDRCASLKLLLPAKGASIQYEKTSRRFGIPHAAVYSTLLSYAKGKNYCRTTEVGVSNTLNGVHRKTVASCLNDLAKLGLITQEREGSILRVTLNEVSDDHLTLFRSRPKREQIEIREPKPPEDPNVYELKGDGYDECRKRCRGHMVQSQAEKCIDLARQLNLSDADFADKVSYVINRDRANKLKGTHSRSNLGAFLRVVLEKMLEEKTRAHKEIEQAERNREWLSSEEFQEEQRKERELIDANPAHGSHFVSEDSILHRVKFYENGLKDRRAASTLISSLSRHMAAFLLDKNLAEPEKVMSLGDRAARGLIGNALQEVNHYYGTESRATQAEFRRRLDTKIAATKERDPLWDVPPFEWPFEEEENAGTEELLTTGES